MSSVKTGESRYRQVAAVCSIVVFAIGGLALCGWITGDLKIAGMFYDWVPMAPSTALLFILFASAILLTSYFDENRQAARLASITVSACGTIAVFLTAISLMGIHSSLEHPGLTIVDIPDLPPRGHISPVTAACFAVAAAAFLLTRLSRTRGMRFGAASRWTSSLLIAANFIFFLAYLFGIPYLYGGSFIPPAAPTIFSFIILGTALFADSAANSPILMMNGTTRSSTRLLIIIFLTLSLGILIAGHLYYRQFEQRQRLEAEKQLSAMADLKVNELVSWRKERLGDGEVIRENPSFSKLAKRLFTVSGDREAASDLKKWLARIKSSYNYDRLVLLDKSCNLRMSVPPINEPLHTCVLDFASRAIRDRKTTFTDFHRDIDEGFVHLSVVVPITDDNGSGTVLGVVIFYIDPAQKLYPFIQKWPIPSKSGEALLVRREGDDVVFLNRLRFNDSPPLSIRIPLTRSSLPAAKAVLGEESNVEGPDYRGLPVLAAIRRVPDSPWFLVSKMDTTEVYAPVRERLWLVLGLMGTLLVSAAAGVGLIWRQQSAAFYKDKLRVELEKRASEAKLEAAIESMPDAVFISDTEGRFIDFNEAFATFHKFRSKEDCAKTLAEYPVFLDVYMDNGEPAPLEQWACPRALRGETGRNAEYTIRRKDTGESWVGRYSFAPIRNEMGLIVGAVVSGRDITDIKRAEAALLESEERYRGLVERAPIAIFVNRNNSIEYANPSAVRLFGAGKSEDIVGKSPYEFVHPNFHAAMTERIGILLSGGSVPLAETSVIGLDGIERQVEVIASVFASPQGQAVQVLMNDISERKRHEEELQKKNLELEQLNYTVSHDLKSPLVTIKTFLGYLAKDMKKGDNARIDQDMAYMQTASERMGILLEDLFNLTRVGRICAPPMDISFRDIVREVVSLVAGRIRQAGVKININDSPVVLHGDKPRLIQLWQNLVDNAVKFMGEQTAPLIELGVEPDGKKGYRFFVRDNGQGIDPRHRDKIFGLFEQLDPRVEGTGIGLALVKRIVDLYGGKLWVESDGPGKGTVFYFTLPGAMKTT